MRGLRGSDLLRVTPWWDVKGIDLSGGVVESFGKSSAYGIICCWWIGANTKVVGRFGLGRETRTVVGLVGERTNGHSSSEESSRKRLNPLSINVTRSSFGSCLRGATAALDFLLAFA